MVREKTGSGEAAQPAGRGASHQRLRQPSLAAPDACGCGGGEGRDGLPQLSCRFSRTQRGTTTTVRRPLHIIFGRRRAGKPEIRTGRPQPTRCLALHCVQQRRRARRACRIACRRAACARRVVPARSETLVSRLHSSQRSSDESCAHRWRGVCALREVEPVTPAAFSQRCRDTTV